MPTYAFFPAREDQRRPDQLGFAVAVGATATAARIDAEVLLGEPNALLGWTAVDLTTAPAVFVSGRPVGSKSGAVWPKLDRGGSFLKGV